MIMKKMGYPTEFVKWCQTLYSRSEVKVINGKQVIDGFKSGSSIRQGCPLSMHLFVIYIEPLIRKIDSTLQGIPIHGNEYLRIQAMVDDVTIFASKETDIQQTSKILNDFCKWSGAVLNEEKTNIMGLGGWTERKNWPINWISSVGTMKLLGINYCQNIEKTCRATWKEVSVKMLGLLKENISRRLTIFQKIQLIKTTVMSKAIYVAETIKKYMRKFVWLGKLERIPKWVDIQMVNKGGLYFTDPEIFFKSLFLFTTYAVLKSGRSIEHKMLKYWISFPLRKILPEIYEGNTTARPVLDYPSYLKCFVKDLKNLRETNAFKEEDRRINHRLAYNVWIESGRQKGKMEEKLPELNWTRIWGAVKRLPPREREVMFRLNHDILPSRERLRRMDTKTNAYCEICNAEIETAIHALTECSSKQDLVEWLFDMLKKNGFNGNRENLIRLDLGEGEDTRRMERRMAAFVDMVWTARKEKRTPTKEDIMKRRRYVEDL